MAGDDLLDQSVNRSIASLPLHSDLGVFVSAFGRYLKDMLQSGPVALQLTGPFSKV